MKLLSKSLFVAVIGLFVAPVTASAAPKPCSQQCTFTGSCTLLCDNGGETVTCGEIGVCRPTLQAAPSEPQASSQPTPASTEEAEQVCQAPATEARS